MNAYHFKTKNHRPELAERNGRPHVSYEKDGKYYIWYVGEDGEYRGQVKDFDKENPRSPTLEHLRGLPLKEFSELFGSWFDPKLEVFDIEPLDCAPGTISNRVWRPCKLYYEGENELSDISEILINQNRSAFNQALVSVDGIVGKLKEVFYTIEPSINNNDVYGHELRNLLLLACMEAEAAFVGILAANNYSGQRWNTTDYVKLKEIFDLNDWSASFTFYPDYGEVCPFSNWDSVRPTESIEWYSAYNKTKHDREGNFDSASFRNVINAVCSAVIMQYAQYGPRPEFKNSNLASICVFPPEDYSFRKFYVPLFQGDRSSWVIEDLQL
ncbi:hypothetical protein C0J08_05875 [Marinomonas sp. CT5]|uniref:hypothetical protein n=1 Tax=Marinomonas sp. CT5 TaxID=2066133 RepID=UPI001BB0A05B|nr:hypothetical protein [Marinomonas sp. CT5]QUX94969.1 hypothetical protein C0J08_05875 [Marinomonas sp. CT5]